MPYDAFDTEREIEDYDIIVMASDGVFDNLFDEDIQACLTKQMTPSKVLSERQLELASDCIVDQAHKLSYAKDYESPFAKEAHA